MNKEILFRGKRIDNGEWIESSSIMQLADGTVNLGSWIINPVIPETVGQFTGEIDRDNKKIFEGDILSVETFYKMPHHNKKTNTYFSVEHKSYMTEAGFMVFGINRRFHKRLTKCVILNSNAKVAGNIFDNPELLK